MNEHLTKIGLHTAICGRKYFTDNSIAPLPWAAGEFASIELSLAPKKIPREGNV